MPDRTIACTLPPAELRSGRTDLLPELAALAGRRTALPNGIRLEFAPTAATLRRIAAVVEQERRCCAFLEFSLRTGRGTGALRLDVTGPEGTVEFLRELLTETRVAIH